MEKKIIHSKDLSVRWGDMDAYGHVNNIFYFLYVQEARADMLLAKNIFQSNESMPVLAEVSCKFIRSIKFPETITIETFFVSANGKKLLLETIIKSSTNHQLVYAILQSTIVWFDFINNCSTELTAHILSSLTE